MQKSSGKASNTINKEHLPRRLELWNEAKLNALLKVSLLWHKVYYHKKDWKLATQTIENPNTSSSTKLLHISSKLET